ncbi:hypothetical protein J6590_036543 [Homalodisca vitripennis]|nr:hypothetical protein J6590_036543 [Homalodisca vitripennis]
MMKIRISLPFDIVQVIIPVNVLKTEGYWDELDRRQPNCLTKARPTAPPITAEHFPFRRRQRCHVSSVVAVIR